MELREGQFWKRKLTGFNWQIEALNPGGTVAIKLAEGEERELLERVEFLEKFTGPLIPVLYRREPKLCAACEGDVTEPHTCGN